MVETLHEKSYYITFTWPARPRPCDVRGDCSCGKFSFVLGDSRLSDVGVLICEHLEFHIKEDFR